MITNVNEYYQLPLSFHRPTCDECGWVFDDLVVLYQLYCGSIYVLCPECARKIGWYLFTDGNLGMANVKGDSNDHDHH